MKATLAPVLLLVLYLGSPAPGRASPPPPPQTAAVVSGATQPVQSSKRPFATLFAGGLQPHGWTPVEFVPERVAVTAERPLNPGERVVCGTTVVPVDPEFDAAMPRVVPDKDTLFFIRRVPPKVCR
jgi:hypothetical protein